NGELSDDWQDAWDSFCGLDLSGKTVALFGLGDQEGYDEEYLDAMGTIYDQVVSSGATVVGEWEVSDEYTHSESKAVRDGKFVGLALDEDNQDDLSDERIEKWCDQIKGSVL
ncbi:MAG: flavodoxin domain-containing protein, partial [Campylobacterales bacterium]|nr:flavodoxin domain-containing protein [Campylobacterales bacterium]